MVGLVALAVLGVLDTIICNLFFLKGADWVGGSNAIIDALSTHVKVIGSAKWRFGGHKDKFPKKSGYLRGSCHREYGVISPKSAMVFLLKVIEISVILPPGVRRAECNTRRPIYTFQSENSCFSGVIWRCFRLGGLNAVFAALLTHVCNDTVSGCGIVNVRYNGIILPFHPPAVFMVEMWVGARNDFSVVSRIILRSC